MKQLPARELFRTYKFKEAVDAYRRQLSDTPDDWPSIEGYGHALMAVGDFAEAIPYLEKVGAYVSSRPGALGREIDLSVCHWMIDERAEAVRIIKGLVIGVRDRKIHYTDFAGGVEQGLILLYMAATLGLQADVDLAMKYMVKLAKSWRIKNWPGPAALFLLGQMSFEDAVKDATGSADLVQAKQIAEQDLMKRRYLTNILFAAAVERRLAGDEPGCRAYMSECASLTSPLVEYAWYLAKGEVGSSFP
jgi:tetratricopeptide (TPR) repeat protein